MGRVRDDEARHPQADVQARRALRVASATDSGAAVIDQQPELHGLGKIYAKDAHLARLRRLPGLGSSATLERRGRTSSTR